MSCVAARASPLSIANAHTTTTGRPSKLRVFFIRPRLNTISHEEVGAIDLNRLGVSASARRPSAARCVPEAQNPQPASCLIQPINDQVGTDWKKSRAQPLW